MEIKFLILKICSKFFSGVRASKLGFLVMPIYDINEKVWHYYDCIMHYFLTDLFIYDLLTFLGIYKTENVLQAISLTCLIIKVLFLKNF